MIDPGDPSRDPSVSLIRTFLWASHSMSTQSDGFILLDKCKDIISSSFMLFNIFKQHSCFTYLCKKHLIKVSMQILVVRNVKKYK